MVKTIGKVKLNLIDCDIPEKKDPFSEELLRIVRDTNPYEYRKIVEDKVSAMDENRLSFLYHLSEVRGNIVRWLPIRQGDAVLELGAECGAITGALLKLSENVSAFTNCGTNAEILAQRHSNCKEFVIYAGAFEACISALVEENRKYDWIIVKDGHELSRVKGLLSDTGRVVFISDNRMGMRNLAGSKGYLHTEYFEGVEGRDDNGFTLPGVKKLAALCGFKDLQLFYPYPDYRFTKTIYSNAHLPKVGELVDNDLIQYSDRMKLFSEKTAFDASCEDGSFQYYSNSYLAILGSPVSTEYVRFSNDRAQEFCIYTSIDNVEGIRTVRKYPVSEAAKDHIKGIYDNFHKLNEKYEGSKLSVNTCSLFDIGASLHADFEYVEGVELTKLLDVCLEKEDYEGFYKLFDKYVELTGFNEDYPYSDIDLVFSNIIVNVNTNTWTLIDYEWCKDTRIPVKETAYRAIYCYLLEDSGRKKINLDLIREKLVLSKEASEDIEEDEALFQKHVTGKNLSLNEITDRMGFNSVDPSKMTVSMSDDKSIYRFRVYPGGPTGEFSEDTAFDLQDVYKSGNLAEALIGVTVDDNILRVDPLDSSCLVIIREATLGELDFPVDNKKYAFSNGKRIGNDTFVFSTDDPNLYFDLNGFIHDEDTILYLKLEIIPLKNDTALTISDHIKRIF